MINLFGIINGIGESSLELKNENRSQKSKTKKGIENEKQNLDFQRVFENEVKNQKGEIE